MQGRHWVLRLAADLLIDKTPTRERLASETEASTTMSSNQWKPGQSGNPAGRKPGNIGGRQKAVLLLDKILAEDDVQAAIQNGLREYFLKKPVQAFRRLVMPLLPRYLKMESNGPAVVVWKSILESYPNPSPNAGAPPPPAKVIDVPPEAPRDNG